MIELFGLRRSANGSQLVPSGQHTDASSNAALSLTQRLDLEIGTAKQ